MIDLIPLTMNMESCATLEEMNANVDATIRRGYTRMNEFLGTRSGTISIVGAGPSVSDTFPALTGDILAINSAVRFLLKNGVVPKFGMLWDASPLVASFVVRHPGITWLVGARCHPDVFDALGDSRIIVWHAGGDHNIREFLEKRGLMEPMINGGSAGVTRALYMALALGYTFMHLHGADSSCGDGGETHVAGSVVPENRMRIWLRNDEHRRLFITTPEMCAQVEEFKLIYRHFTSIGIDVRVHGDGLLPVIWRRLKADLEFQAGQISEEECCARLVA